MAAGAVTPALVRGLLAAQFPHWKDLPITPVASAGTDNALFRLGSAMAVRLPRAAWAGGQAAREWRHLPGLAGHLPLEVPVPLALGAPGEGFGAAWSVCRWVPGQDAQQAPPTDMIAAAGALARFVRALRAIPAAGGPAPGAANSGRGVALAARDAAVRRALGACDGLVDTAAAARAWERALDAPVWADAPAWLHGDLHPANLVVRDGALAGVIDFGCMAVGDPACDLMPAWSMFAPAERAVFRAGAGMDAAAWARGRGWALSVALIALPYYLASNAAMVAMSRRVIAAVLAEEAGR